MNPGKITPALQILFVCIAIEEPTAAKWWEENRAVLKSSQHLAQIHHKS